MDARNVDPRRVDGSKNHLSQPRPAAVIILISLFSLTSFPLAGVGGGGGITGCNNPSSLHQCGTANCTILGTATPGQQACQTTVTFPVAFANIPTSVSAQWVGFNSGVNHAEKLVPIASTYFESDLSETWAAFPVATTELYGDINHETSISTGATQPTVSVEFYVTCTAQAGVQTGTETLKPQYFDPNSASWKELANIAGTLDLVVGAIFCGTSGSQAESVGTAAISTNFFTVGATQLRVVGFGGGGAGDSMTFNEIYLLFYGEYLETPVICIQVTSPCPVGTASTSTPLSKTQMVIAVEIPFPKPVSDFKVNMIWTATE